MQIDLTTEEIAALELAIFALREQLEKSPYESDHLFSQRLAQLRDRLAGNEHGCP